MTENSGNIFGVAPDMVRRVMTAPPRLALGMGRQAVRAGMVATGQQHISERIRRELPLHEADVVGRSAIKHGERKGDEQLMAIGEAIVAKAVVRAANDEEVPHDITQKVIDVARQQGIDPLENPYVPETTAHRAQKLLDNYDA